MTQPYRDFLDLLADHGDFSRELTLQVCFIVYLVLGQVLVLLGWQGLRGVAGRLRPRPRLPGVLFAVYLLAAQGALLLAWPRLASYALTTRPRVVLADVVVIGHVTLVLAALVALPLVLAGGPLGWGWTRNFWFRLGQLLVIEVVAGQAVVDIECPLTTIERQFRGGPGYLYDLDEASALGRFCNDMLYFDPREAGSWLLAGYVTFGLLVVLSWVLVPPRFPWRRTPHSSISS